MPRPRCARRTPVRSWKARPGSSGESESFANPTTTPLRARRRPRSDRRSRPACRARAIPRASRCRRPPRRECPARPRAPPRRCPAPPRAARPTVTISIPSGGPGVGRLDRGQVEYEVRVAAGLDVAPLARPREAPPRRPRCTGPSSSVTPRSATQAATAASSWSPAPAPRCSGATRTAPMARCRGVCQPVSA